MRLLICLMFLSLGLSSQPWMDGLSEAEKNNFFAIQDSYYNYIQGKDKSIKGTGHKQFKRWEWFWESRVLEDGSFPDDSIFRSAMTRDLKGNPTKLNSVNVWKTIGPDSSPGGYEGLGRINVVRAEPGNNAHLWAGAASGGLWYSSNTGQTWECKSDEESVFEVLGISDIAFDPFNSDIIYIASGDRDGQDTYSSGLLKSTDGGETWNDTGLNYDVKDTRVRLNKIIIDPNNSDIIIVGGSNGIWKSTNGGNDWTRVRSNYHVLDMEMKPNNFNVLYASSNSYRILRSLDGGENWNELSHNNLPDTGVQRVAIAVTKDDPEYLVAVMSAPHSGLKGVYRSDDSGDTWIQIAGDKPNMLHWGQNSTEDGGQGWYDLCIEINPVDKDEIFIGGVNLWQTSNGGIDWEISTMWHGGTNHPTIHADQHDIWYTQDGSRLLIGNDGGVYKTDDSGNNYDWIGSGKNTTQFYRIDASQQTLDKLIGGSQDNGTKLRINEWDHVIGGDGMECLIYEKDDNLVLGSYQYGNIFKSVNGGTNFRRINSANGSDYKDIDEEGAWITPFAVSPSDTNNMIVGMVDMWISVNGGATFTEVDTEQNSKWQFIEYTPSDENKLYAATNNQVWYSDNGGSSWVQKTRPGNQRITSIEPHPTDPNTIWATNGNWNKDNKVFKSTNNGDTWENLTDGLPNLPANCIFYQKDSDNRIYVGTDIGVYFRDDNSNGWLELNDGLPNAIVSDIEFNYENERIYAGTYGRGVWYYDINPSIDMPNLLNISDGEIAVELDDITLEWNSVAEATKYLIQISTNSNFSELIVDDNNLTDTTKILSGLENFNTYYWRVKAANGFAESDWTEIREFRTKMATPTLELPIDESTARPLDDVLGWADVIGAERYDIEVSNNFTFDDIAFTAESNQSGYEIDFSNGLDHYSNYFWRVKAVRSDEETIWSDKFEFQTIIGQATLVTPIDEAIDINLSGTFTWDAITGADTYELEISDSNEFSNIITSETAIANNFYSYDNLEFDSQYFWRVRGSYEGGNGEWSEINSFKTSLQPLEITEFADIYSQETEVQINWSNVGEQINYTLQLSLDNTFAEPIAEFSSIAPDAEAYTLTSLDNNTSYFVRIRRNNLETSSAWSDFVEFVTKPKTVQLDFPKDNFIDFTNENIFSWNEIPGVESYQIQVSEQSDFSSDIVYDNETSGSEFKPAGLNAGKVYFWRVRAISFNGNNFSDWSETRSITTKIGLPNLIEPANNSIITGNEVTLVWEEFENADSYTLEVATDNNFSSIYSNNTLPESESKLSNLTPNDYFWRVKATVAATESDWSAIWKFSVPAPLPEPPQLVSPQDLSENIIPDNIVLEWEEIAEADSYVVEVSNSNDFSDLEYKVSDIEALSTMLVSFKSESEYFWRVFAKNENGLSESSEIWSFTTGKSEDSEWTQAFPPNNSKGIEYEDLKLSWEKTTDDAQYNLHLFKESDNNLDQKIENISGETSYTVNLEPNTNYFWFIESMIDAEVVEKTNTWSFKTKLASSVLENNKADSFKIYPNPAKDELNLVSTNGELINSFQIYDINGTMLLSRSQLLSSSLRIDINKFPVGKYLIKFNVEGRKYNMNFTINR